MEHLIVSAIFWGKVLQENYRIPVLTPRKTLIFAPHPDDEILCCADKISQKLYDREKVKVVFITDGDARSKRNYNASRSYALTRRKESRNAAKKLGLKKSDLHFLGFPDGMLHKLNFTSLKSPFSGRVDTPLNSFSPQTPYTKPNLERIITKLLNEYSPYEVFLPSNKDIHPDHTATGKIIKDIIRREGLPSKVYEYVVHQKNPVIANDVLPNRKKLELISLFKSQFHDKVHRKFLEYFAYIPEMFSLVILK